MLNFPLVELVNVILNTQPSWLESNIVVKYFSVSTFAYPISALSREIDMFIIMLVPMFAYAGNYCSKKYYSAIKVVSVLLIVPQYFMIFAYY